MYLTLCLCDRMRECVRVCVKRMLMRDMKNNGQCASYQFNGKFYWVHIFGNVTAHQTLM